MSEIHIEEHSSPIKTPKQLVIVVVLAFAVPITLIVMLVQLVTSGADLSRNNPGMSQEAIAKRLKPVGEVVVDPNQPAPAAAPASAETVATAAPAPGVESAAAKPDAGRGKSVYDATCSVCHAAGVAGAPKAGDKAAWASRMKTGISALYASRSKARMRCRPRAAISRSPTPMSTRRWITWLVWSGDE